MGKQSIQPNSLNFKIILYKLRTTFGQFQKWFFLLLKTEISSTMRLLSQIVFTGKNTIKFRFAGLRVKLQL